MTTFNAQEYLEKNFSKKTETIISRGSLRLLEQKLIGDLVIQDCSELEEINLHDHELTSLVIINCPQLKRINVRNNKLTKLELEKVKIDSEDKPISNEITEIVANGNELITLDLIYCEKVSKLMVADNSYLNKLQNLNLSTIKDINITNTSVSLTEDYEGLKQENDNLYEILKGINETGQEKKLVLTEAITTSKQAEEAVQRLLRKIEQEWREYFESENQDIDQKNSLLDLSFKSPELNWKGREILTWIIEAQVNGDYWDLVKKWTGSKDFDYNSTYDFDGSLYTLMQYLGIRDGINQKNLEHHER